MVHNSPAHTSSSHENPSGGQRTNTYPPVVLVPLVEEHLDLVMRWVNDRDVTKNFQNFNKKLSREDELAFIRSMCASPCDQLFSIFDAETNVYVGQGGINSISLQNKLGRLGIFIDREHQGQGYGHSAVRAIVERAFNEMGLEKVWLMVFASNAKAQRLYRRIGFKQEGLLVDEYTWNGEKHDVVRMAILKKNYNT